MTRTATWESNPSEEDRAAAGGVSSPGESLGRPVSNGASCCLYSAEACDRADRTQTHTVMTRRDPGRVGCVGVDAAVASTGGQSPRTGHSRTNTFTGWALTEKAAPGSRVGEVPGLPALALHKDAPQRSRGHCGPFSHPWNGNNMGLTTLPPYTPEKPLGKEVPMNFIFKRKKSSQPACNPILFLSRESQGP